MSAQPLSVVEYAAVAMPPAGAFKTEEEQREWLETQLLAVQGEAALLPAGLPLVLAARLTAALDSLCPELILETSGGPAIIIFDHQPVKVLRPSDVVAVAFPLPRLSEMSLKENIIDLSAAWERTEGDLTKRIKAAGKTIAPCLVPSQKTIIKTDSGAKVLTLLVIHALWRCGGELRVEPAGEKAFALSRRD